MGQFNAVGFASAPDICTGSEADQFATSLCVQSRVAGMVQLRNVG